MNKNKCKSKGNIYKKYSYIILVNYIIYENTYIVYQLNWDTATLTSDNNLLIGSAAK